MYWLIYSYLEVKKQKKKKKTKEKDDDDDETTSGSAVIGWRSSGSVLVFQAAVWSNSPTVGKNEPLTLKQTVNNL